MISIINVLLWSRFSLRPPTLIPLPLILPKSEQFSGGLFGVSAKVDLCLKNESALVSLSGAPLGGTISGLARFSSVEGSDLEFDEPLKTSLRRRFVKILGVSFDRKSDIVYVDVQLPLLLGRHTIELTRSSTKPDFNPTFCN